MQVDFEFDESDDEVTAPWRPQQGARVLLADDDAGMRELLAETFGRDGYDVQVTGSAVELLERLDALGDPTIPGPPVDLVVTDVRMPGMSGVELVKQLSQREAQVPAILMTAYPDEQVEAAARELRVPLLCKPFQLDEMSRVALRTLLGGSNDR